MNNVMRLQVKVKRRQIKIERRQVKVKVTGGEGKVTAGKGKAKGDEECKVMGVEEGKAVEDEGGKPTGGEEGNAREVNEVKRWEMGLIMKRKRKLSRVFGQLDRNIESSVGHEGGQRAAL